MFFILFITSVTLTIILKKRMEQVIPIAVLAVILIIYIMGLFDNLRLGVLIICISILAELIFIAVYLSKKINNLKTILSQILTPGLAIYIGLFVISIILSKGRIFEDYDEYNHWGIMIKNMFLYNSYGTNPESIVAFNDYPPLTSIFQYLFIQIKGIYREDVIITAQNILYFSMIIPITKNITWKKDFKQILLASMIILFVPMIFYANFYTNILVDGILGIAFSYTIYSSYREEEDIKFQFLEIFCGITILMLTKTQGIGLAILAITIIGSSLFFERKKAKEKTKEKIKLLIIVIVGAVLLLSIWQIKVKQEKHRWDLTRIYKIDTTEQNEEFTKAITKEFINAIFKVKCITERKVTTFSVIVGIFALIAVQYYKMEKQKKKRYGYYAISMLIGTILYLIAMLWMYCTIFDTDEALILASFSRYIFTIVVADTMFFSFVLLEEKRTSVVTIGIMILILIMMPFSTLQQKYLNKNKYLTLSNSNRWQNIRIIKYKDSLDKEDKILYISNKNIGNSIIQLALNQYIMMPIRIDAVVPGTIGELENLVQAIQKEDYTHVFVYRATSEAKEEYSTIFEDNEMKNDTLYEIQLNEKEEIKLIEVKQ